MRWTGFGIAVVAGLVAGTIDIGSACLINHLPPVVILHAIASGLYGRNAFTGGLPMAAVGLILQWAMSILIAGIYVAAATRLRWLTTRWLAGGLAYGVGIYVVMTFIVVPLSQVVSGGHHTVLWMLENLLAMLLFGLIVSTLNAFARLRRRA
jgi:uncharacterized membrane protein YagU involved in acid resistance